MARPTPPPLPLLLESGEPRDVREEFARKAPPDRDEQESVKAFIEAKWDMLRSDPSIDPRLRQVVFADFMWRLQHGTEMPPIPGGNGFGAFYTPGFKTAFTGGTSLYWHPICPTPPGGNISTFFYLTGMNRASFGCEALVFYNGQDHTHFSVYDWSRPEPDRWKTDIAFSSLTDYLGEEKILGVTRQVLPIWNSTYQIFEVEEELAELGDPIRRWRNDVHLYNFAEKRWNLIYRNDYPAALSRQRGSTIGSWAATVETFQGSYHGTNDFGTTVTQINTEDGAGRWGGWDNLSPKESTIRTDHLGFFSRLLVPNFRWVVGS